MPERHTLLCTSPAHLQSLHIALSPLGFLPKPILLLSCHQVNSIRLQDPICPASTPESPWFLAQHTHSWLGLYLCYEASSLFWGCQVPHTAGQLAAGHALWVVTCLMKPTRHLPFGRRDGGKQTICLSYMCALVWLFCSVWLTFTLPRLPSNLRYWVKEPFEIGRCFYSHLTELETKAWRESVAF